jgi:hypothetical protein
VTNPVSATEVELIAEWRAPFENEPEASCLAATTQLRSTSFVRIPTAASKRNESAGRSPGCANSIRRNRSTRPQPGIWDTKRRSTRSSCGPFTSMSTC